MRPQDEAVGEVFISVGGGDVLGGVFYLSALRSGTQTGWAWIQVPGFSESLFFRYVDQDGGDGVFEDRHP